MIPVLVDNGDLDYVIKKGTTYACIATETLKFLDIISYIAPGIWSRIVEIMDITLHL